MAIVTRYFDVTAAGAGDGTTWADRAALFTGGAWATIITAFSFAGLDSLRCLVGPGTYTITASLAAASFASAPTYGNPIMFHGCDSSGVQLVPPDLDWTSDQPAWSTTGVPVVATTTNISICSVPNSTWRMFIFTSSGYGNYPMQNMLLIDWCQITNSNSGTGSGCCSAVSRISNSVLALTGTSFAAAISWTNGAFPFSNVRIVGNTNATGGTRYGIVTFSSTGGNNFAGDRIMIVGCPGGAFSHGGTNGANISWRKVSIYNCGWGFNSQLASQHIYIVGASVVNTSGYGILMSPVANLLASSVRLRNNFSGNISYTGNYSTDWDWDTSAGTDAAEYVSVASGDYRNKFGSSIWGKGYGVSDEMSITSGVSSSSEYFSSFIQ